MDKQQLYARTKALWPDAITSSPEDKCLDALNNIYSSLEERLEAQGDDWSQLAAWAFHQALWHLARETRPQVLRPSELSFEAFDRQMKANLSDDSWAEVRREYDHTL